MELPKGSFIASGPVIIEHDKVLLNREQKTDGDTPWMFPGGQVENFDTSLEEACHREVKEEMGIDIEIIRPLRPIMLQKNGYVIVLVHYLAKRLSEQEITPANNIVEWDWHDVRNLPKNCAPNVPDVIQSYLDEQK